MRREVSLRTFAVFLLFASAAGAENRVAVLPLEPRAGALGAADALTLSQDLRAAVAPCAAADAGAAHSRAQSPTTAAATRASPASSTERGPARDPDPRDHRGRRAGPRHPPQAEPQGADPG